MGGTSRRWQDYGLTAGELGAAAGQTVVVAVLPLLLMEDRPSALWVGVAIGGEGVVALLLPFWVGGLSDHLSSRLAARFGRRTFFLLLAAPVMTAALALLPFLEGYWPRTLVAYLFFAALHTYLTPLWALMIDAVPDQRRGRVQGVRGTLRAGGLAFGLVASGALFELWRPLPFLLAALLVVVTTLITWRSADEARRPASPEERESVQLREKLKLLRRKPGAARYLAANALWSGAIDGIRPYVYLFATVVIGLTTGQTSAALVILAVGLAAGSLAIGRAGDRQDRGRLLLGGLALLTIGMIAGFWVRSLLPAVGVLFVAGVGAAAIAALSYPLFANYVGESYSGQFTGVFVTSVGIGRVFAPLLVGGAIDIGQRWLPETRGYPVMWPVVGLFAGLACLALLWARRARNGGLVLQRGD